MKIAMIDPSLFTLPYDEALCLALNDRGAQVTLYGRPPRADEPPLRLDVHHEPIFYTNASVANRVWEPLRLGIKAADHVVSLARLLRRLGDEQPDIVHFQWTPLPMADRHALHRLAQIAPLILTVHDTRPFNGRASVRLQHVGAQTIYDTFDRLIVHTRAGLERLSAQGACRMRIVCIPHGPFNGAVSGSLETTESGDGKITLLLVGKLKPYKGADVLIKALGLIPRALRQNVRCVIAGKPYFDTTALKDLSLRCGVSDIVTFDFAFLPEAVLANYLARASVLVFPYREIEASGVLFSALQHGKPIVASRLGSFAELLEDGVHGRLVPPDNPQALADALAALLCDAEARTRMGQAVAQLAATIPGWDVIAERTLALYDAVLAERAQLLGHGQRLQPVA